MNESYYRISLDIKSIQSQISLPIKQGDTSRGIYISLTDGGKPYTIARGCYAVIKGEKSDGTEIGNNCYIENNRIVYPITQHTVSAPGIVECEVSLYNSEVSLITSPRFTLIVDARAVGGNEYTSSSEYRALETYLGVVTKNEEARQKFIKEITDIVTIDELYAHYQVNREKYPYIFIVHDGGVLYTYFASAFNLNENDELRITNYFCSSMYVNSDSLASMKCKDVCGLVLSNDDIWWDDNTNEKCYDNTSCIYTNYPLPESWKKSYQIPYAESIEALIQDVGSEMIKSLKIEFPESKLVEYTESATDEEYYSAKAVNGIVNTVAKGLSAMIKEDINNAIGVIENGSY